MLPAGALTDTKVRVDGRSVFLKSVLCQGRMQTGRKEEDRKGKGNTEGGKEVGRKEGRQGQEQKSLHRFPYHV